MKRTSNTFRVTFSANIDGGEGYLTHRNQDALDVIIDDHGWLWAKDVLSDWKAEIERSEECAQAAFLGWIDEGSPNSRVETTIEGAAKRLWKGGVWPDMFMLTYYECHAQIYRDMPEGIDPYSKFDDYACGPEFFGWMLGEAKKEAGKYIEAMKSSGVHYAHGRHPSFRDLVEYYVMLELIGGQDGAEAVLSEKHFSERCKKQERDLRKWAISEVRAKGEDSFDFAKIDALMAQVVAGEVDCPVEVPDLRAEASCLE